MSPIVVLLFVAGVLFCLLYGVCASIGTLLSGLGSFAALLALLAGSYAEALASVLVALLLCPFTATAAALGWQRSDSGSDYAVQLLLLKELHKAKKSVASAADFPVSMASDEEVIKSG